jgi:hypothetical protein
MVGGFVGGFGIGRYDPQLHHPPPLPSTSSYVSIVLFLCRFDRCAFGSFIMIITVE